MSDRSMLGKLVDLTQRIVRLERRQARQSGDFGRGYVGTVGWTAGSSAPPGALMMNGQAVSRTTYAALFAEIGTTYGVGDGTTTFNLPDARGRVIAHRATSGNLAPLGATFGTETHTLTNSEMPSHDHGGTTGNQSVSMSSGAVVGTGNYPARGGGAATAIGPVGNTSHSHTIPSQGGGGAHNNVQPTLVLNGFIWT